MIEHSHNKMEFVGRKVRITLKENSFYDGFVHSVDKAFGKLTLEKVVCTDEDGERTKLIGLQHLFISEISDIAVAEEVNKSRSFKDEGDDRKKHGDRCIMKPKWSNPHLDRLGPLNPKALTLKNTKYEDGMTSSGNEEAVSSGTEDDIIIHTEYTVIGTLNSIFYDAIHHISKHVVVGVAMEGVSVGRNGKLCWVQFAVQDAVIVFDILKLGESAFEEGLQDILESETILKVFHDCRMVSDMMYHQYNVNLVNVFDTQVASAVVYRLQHHNDWPRHVHGLASCLIEHLDIPESQINWAVVREGFRESDEEVWLQRPAKQKHLQALVKNVIHLLDLRLVLMEKMMEEFVAGVNIYLSHVRDASNGDIQKYQKMSHLLPSVFQDIKHFMRSYTGRRQFKRSEPETRDSYGFRENYSPIKQPNLVFSRDSLWHVGNKIPPRQRGENDPKQPPRYADQLSHLMPKNDKNNFKNPIPDTPSSPPTPLDRIEITAENGTIQDLKQQCFTDHNSDTETAMNIQSRNKTPVLPTAQREQSIPNLSDYVRTHSETEVRDCTENHSISKLMRALVQEQAPPGSENHPEMDQISFMPAGAGLKNRKRINTPSVSQPVIHHDDQTMFRPDMKQLTEQEIRLVKRIGSRSDNDYRNGHISDNDIINPAKSVHSIESHSRQGHRDFEHSKMQKSPVNIRSEQRNVPFQSRANNADGPRQFKCADTPQKPQCLSPPQHHSDDDCQSRSLLKQNMNPTSPLPGRLQALMNAMNGHTSS